MGRLNYLMDWMIEMNRTNGTHTIQGYIMHHFHKGVRYPVRIHSNRIGHHTQCKPVRNNENKLVFVAPGGIDFVPV